MPSTRIFLRIFLSVFIGVVFPPSIILIWTGRFKDFAIVLVAFLFLMIFARNLTPLSLLLAVYFVLEFRAEFPKADDTERDL